MTELIVTVDGVRGDVKIILTDPNNNQQTIKLRWYKADDDSTGFITNVTQNPIPVTEVAAETMIKIILAGLMNVFTIQPGELKAFNHLGEQLKEIEFMPPTFDGKEADIQRFVARQDSLKNLYSSYEQERTLDRDLLDACQDADVLDDFLSLVQFQLSRVEFTFSNPKEE